MLSRKEKRELKIDQRQLLIDSIEIGIPSPEQILLWGRRYLPNRTKVGLVKNSKTVNYKKFTPSPDGLFCERIFGPVTSFVCACGKKQPNNKVTFCEKCEVQYINQRSRRYRLGYISFLSPVTHIWYLKGRPSYISLFLGKRKKTVIGLAYCNSYLIEHGISSKKNTYRDARALHPLRQILKSDAKELNFLSKTRQIHSQRQQSNFLLTKRTPVRYPTSCKKSTQEGFLRNGKKCVRTSFLPRSCACKTRWCTQVRQPPITVRLSEAGSSFGLRYHRTYDNPSSRSFPKKGASISKLSFPLAYEAYTPTVMQSLSAHARVPAEIKVSKKHDTRLYNRLYIRQQSLPFLPVLVCNFYLRDTILDYLSSLPTSYEIPLSTYCETRRCLPLRNVYTFMAEQTISKLERMESEEPKKSFELSSSPSQKGRTRKAFVVRGFGRKPSPTTSLQNNLFLPRCSAYGDSQAKKASTESTHACLKGFASLEKAVKYKTKFKEDLQWYSLDESETLYDDKKPSLQSSTARKNQNRALLLALSGKARHGHTVNSRLVFDSQATNFICKKTQTLVRRHPIFLLDVTKGVSAHEEQQKQVSISLSYKKHRFLKVIARNRVFCKHWAQRSWCSFATQGQQNTTQEVLTSTQSKPNRGIQESTRNGVGVRVCKTSRKVCTTKKVSLAKQNQSSLAASSVRSCVLAYKKGCKLRLLGTRIPSVLFPSILPARVVEANFISSPVHKKVRTHNNEIGAQESVMESDKTNLASGLEIKAIREILSYTGGGGLHKLLHHFDTHLFQTLLFSETEILRNRYTQIIDPFGGCYPGKRSGPLLYSESEEENKYLSDLSLTGFESIETESFLTSLALQKTSALRFSRRMYKESRRLKVVKMLSRNNRRPEWMILSHLPVLPPDLRPIVQMSENLVVASDLNNLYQRVIYRNNRHTRLRFIDFHLVTGIQRLVQDAVDRLIENGKGGSKPYYTPGGRALKSLSDSLKGKKGRFRLNLLGKRVDFSARSVIVVSPSLKIHECGLPKEIALELYHYFVLRELLLRKHCSSIVVGKKIIKERSAFLWHILRDLMYQHPVLLNRAPTLHRLGIQAFQPKLIDGNAILLHPLVCSAFNADFDGDQMGVHLPLSFSARAESWDLLWSRNNLLSPATGQPMLLPSQDMVLGFYYMTAVDPSLDTLHNSKKENSTSNALPKNLQASDTHTLNTRTKKRSFYYNKFLVKKDSMHSKKAVLRRQVEVLNAEFPKLRDKIKQHQLFSTINEMINRFQKGTLALHTPVWLKWEGKIENDEHSQKPLEVRLNGLGSNDYIFAHHKYSRSFLKTGTNLSLFFGISREQKKKFCNPDTCFGGTAHKLRSQQNTKNLKTPISFCLTKQRYHVRTTVGRVLVNNILRYSE